MAVGHAGISLTYNLYDSDLLGIRLSSAMKVNALRQRYPAEGFCLNGFEFFQKIDGIINVGDMSVNNVVYAVIAVVVFRVHKLQLAWLLCSPQAS